jgi:2-polyprenyl-6-hydroxyphenyl methylase/3-demethylubiquinone-9 3-methyltransferase
LTDPVKGQSDARSENVDPAELAKFEALAARWWDSKSEFRPLHEINPLRVDFINHRTPLKDLKVLDVGCGGGLLSEAMADLGATVTGIDLGDAPLAVARLHLVESGLLVDYIKTSAEDLADRLSGEFDVVTCLEMLEHVPDPASIVAACASLCKPGGHLYFSTINRNPKSWLFAVVGAEYVLNLLPRGTHDYNKFIRPSELDGWSREAGLRSLEITGLHYNPISGKYWLGKGVDVNYMIHATRDA